MGPPGAGDIGAGVCPPWAIPKAPMESGMWGCGDSPRNTQGHAFCGEGPHVSTFFHVGQGVWKRR